MGICRSGLCSLAFLDGLNIQISTLLYLWLKHVGPPPPTTRETRRGDVITLNSPFIQTLRTLLRLVDGPSPVARPLTGDAARRPVHGIRFLGTTGQQQRRTISSITSAASSSSSSSTEDRCLSGKGIRCKRGKHLSCCHPSSSSTICPSHVFQSYCSGFIIGSIDSPMAPQVGPFGWLDVCRFDGLYVCPNSQ